MGVGVGQEDADQAHSAGAGATSTLQDTQHAPETTEPQGPSATQSSAQQPPGCQFNSLH